MAYNRLNMDLYNTTNNQSEPTASGEHTTLSLLGISDLLYLTFRIYKDKFLSIIGVIALGFALVAGTGLMLVLTLLPLVFLPFGFLGTVFASFILGIAVWFIIFWCYLSLLSVIVRSTGVIDSYKYAFSRIISFFWVMSLTFFVTFGYIFLVSGITVLSSLFLSSSNAGWIAFFAIPINIAIMATVTVWLNFTAITFITEERRGMSALSRSREYVRHRWWSVAWRILAVSIPVFILYSLLEAIDVALLTIIFWFIFFFTLLPLRSIYNFTLYKELSRTQRPSSDQEYRTKRNMKIVGALGILVMLASIVLVSYFIASAPQNTPSDVMDFRSNL